MHVDGDEAGLGLRVPVLLVPPEPPRDSAEPGTPGTLTDSPGIPQPRRKL